MVFSHGRGIRPVNKPLVLCQPGDRKRRFYRAIYMEKNSTLETSFEETLQVTITRKGLSELSV